MTSPLFSFVMPAYNAQETIVCAIRSVLHQSIADWELNIVDDNSTDETENLIKTLVATDNRIHYYKLTQNSGSAFYPRKIAILNSRGKYIVSIDSDDEIESDYIQKLKTIIESYSPDIILTTFRTDRGNILPKTPYHGVYEGKNLIRETLDGWKINAGGAAIKKGLLNEIYNKYDFCECDISADEVLTRYALYGAKKVCFSDAVYYYHSNPNSITRKISFKTFTHLDSLIRLKDFIIEEYGEKSLEDNLINKEIGQLLISLPLLYADNKIQLSSKKQEILKKIKSAKKKMPDFQLWRQFSLKNKILYILPSNWLICIKVLKNRIRGKNKSLISA